MFKKIINLFYWLLLLILICFGALLVLSKAGVGNYQAFVITSGSMEPTIKTGSVVVSQAQADYATEEIITYKKSKNAQLAQKNSTVTHRIFGIKETEGVKEFSTKGDANESVDPQMIVKEQIVGRVIFNLPYLGYLVNLLQSQLGFVGLIIIPATLIIFTEIMNIKNQVISKFKKKSPALKEDHVQED